MTPHSLLTLADFAFDWSRALAPFSSRWWMTAACSALVGCTLGVLGCFVVLRRMALIGDALSHSVLPGVVTAFLLLGVLGINLDSGWGAVALMTGALTAGLITSLLVAVVGRNSRVKEDSAIGIVFTSMFAVGIILISGLPRGTHFDLKCFLFGEPLAVRSVDLIMLSIVTAAVLILVAILYHPLKLMIFDPTLAAAMDLPVRFLHYLLMGILAAAVVSGLTTTGVIMVVAMVITPAAGAYQLTNRFGVMLILAGLLGTIAAVMGMSLAFVTNWPTGPAMVLVASFLFIATLILSPEHGRLFQLWRQHRRKQHFQTEDILKAHYKLSEQNAQATRTALSQITGLSQSQVQRVLQQTDNQAYWTFSTDNQTTQLTNTGRQQAIELVRAHRLWETYLADQTQITGDPLHEQADLLEHAHELADEIDATLDHPQTDPHGQPIPQIFPPKIKKPQKNNPEKSS